MDGYPAGRIAVGAGRGQLVPGGVLHRGGCPRRPTPLLREAQRQLEEYFACRRQVFDLPLAGQGTAFQQQVWAELLQIPYGQVCSYGQLADRLGRPGAAAPWAGLVTATRWPFWCLVIG